MKYLKTIVAAAICCASLFSCDTSAPPDPAVRQTQRVAKPEPTAVNANPTADVSTFPVNKGWGYRIFMNNKPYIYQANIPAIQGKKPFATQEDAQKVGDWVINQIKRGKLFDVSKPIMDSLGVKY